MSIRIIERVNQDFVYIAEHSGFTMDQQLDNDIRAMLNGIVTAQMEAREKALEAALQSGTCGVLERREEDGSVEFLVTEAVPYGQIWVLDTIGRVW